jgi:hypothetical protein
MKRLAVIVTFVLAGSLAGCGGEQQPAALPAPTKPPSELFTWDDESRQAGNVDADFADCKAQLEKDPALGPNPPDLAVLSAYIKCMQPKGWKFVNPTTAQP